MIHLLVATTNPGKLREIRELLSGVPVTLSGLHDLPSMPEPEETGRTFAENARLKAIYYDFHKGSDPLPTGDRFLTVAEDSGLVIDALDGEPGVYSARFLRPDATYPERFAEIERRLAAVPERRRTARFTAAVAVVERHRVIYETAGNVEGEIAPTASGHAGFGYDPIFFYPPYGATLAAVTQEQKLHVAHRGQAFRALAAWLKNQERRN